MAESWIEIGRVGSINPARREVRIAVEPGRAHEFEAMEWVRLRPGDGAPVRCRVDAVKRTASDAVLVLAPGVPRDSVARMKGAAVVVAKEELKPRPAGVYVVADLPGMTVVDRDGRPLGTVRDAFETAAHGVMEVDGTAGGSFSLPVVDETMAEVDVERGVVVVNDIAPYVVYDED
ncbi:MAG: PRC-barrel domain-containing protein [Candidatus Hydrogenedentes bacterium]|nr:PRC-barrel domain-containing protein [Candidatus Hydrogenedentota bacterium]